MLTEQHRLRRSCAYRKLVIRKLILLKQVCKPDAVLEVHFEIIVYAVEVARDHCAHIPGDADDCANSPKPKLHT